MRLTIYLITLIVIVLSTSACQRETGASESVGMEIEASGAINPPIRSDRIKNATLLIVVESIQPDGVSLGYEMGTLVQVQGETYLVTHNHYGDMLQDGNILEVRDAENHMIRSLYGYEFNSLIVYQDPGTLVLRAPDGLTDVLTPVNVDHQPQLQPGDIVQVAYRGGSEQDKVGILNAVIEEATVSGVTPVYRLRYPNGPRLSPGDSGGGVWYGERFIGNTWSIVEAHTIKETSGASDPAGITQTNLSYTAMFPALFR